MTFPTFPAGAAVRVFARLRALPFPDEPVKACLRCVPLEDAREYAVVADYEIDAPEPVRLSPAQRYRVLAEIVERLRRDLPEAGPVVLAVSGSEFLIPVPAALLADGVALVHDPVPLLGRLLDEGHANVIGIWPALRSDGFMPGDNTLRLALFAAGPAARARFRAMMAEEGVLQRFSDVEVTADD